MIENNTAADFQQLLIDLRDASQSKAEQGTAFERLMKKYFQTSPLYAEVYETVWLWSEFPYNENRHDFGIDLVAKMKNADEYVAIQCKFYDENNYVSKSDIDTFLSASGKPFYVDGQETRYSARLIVSTTDKWTSTAEDTIKGQIPAVSRIRLQDLSDSGIDWSSFTLRNIEDMKATGKKHERPHQKRAISAVIEGFKSADRGKVIMACGTGKTFTAMKIAEAQTNGTGNVLFLVPSISLLNQTISEWCTQCKYKFSVYAICSDAKASKIEDNSDDISDVIIPATTSVNKLIAHYNRNNSGDEQLNFFFSTYQSIDVVSEFQKKSGITFDICICDEAHRTTGVTIAGEDESNFVKIHNDSFIKASKRLYMTATPRIYGDNTKKKADENSAVLCSMDDESIYGKEFFRLGFSEAVSLGLLSDYKVIVLAVDEDYVSVSLQNLLTDRNSELTLEDSTKILGCLNGLSKRTLFKTDVGSFESDPVPMKRAVAFTNSIKNSKRFVQLFQEVQDEIDSNGHDPSLVSVELGHVDGTNNALFRKGMIDWLKDDPGEGKCRVLSNARCLSEGIDVPALDAVMFLSPRNSIVDIIQSVGRVMRKYDGKKYGYIILPIGIPAGKEPEEALKDNKKYKIVWDVLQALRAHDDRFNNTINKIDLNKNKPGNIQIIGVGGGSDSDGEGEMKDGSGHQFTLDLGDLQKWKDSVYAKIVQKCGSRQYWETWAKDIAEIANRHIEEIKLLIKKPEISPKFKEFVKALQSNLNSSIKQADAIEMLAEHMITKPVFDALFEGYEFIKSNPVSQIMQEMLDILNEKALDKEQETLSKFYLSVQERAKGIDNAEGKQKIVIELYEQFFKNALPKQVAKLGIVYTPIEVVDFIIKSVNEVLKDKFGSSLNDDGVHILDPFTGTGTFIVQLLRSGLIDKDKLLYKYTNEIHANEIVLLAYYIAAVNIEETFHYLTESEEYVPFEGIVLTDTFALSENVNVDDSGKMVSAGIIDFKANSDRAMKQLKSPITVIIGNPPYSMAQKSANDNNQNVKYESLDKSIANTYVAKSKATASNSAYDTYVKSFRWATDRLGENGVIGFVTNGSFLDSLALDGFRECLLEDFNSIYVFNLRGNQRTSGELSRREGGKIFGSGSRTPVAITILVKKKGVKKDRFVRYYDIGDYLSREKKLAIIKDFGDITAIPWKIITPNENNDWINQRNSNFINFIPLGDKKKRESESIFSDNYAVGLCSSRDAWVFNYSQSCAKNNSDSMISFYNSELERCFEELGKNSISPNSDSAETYLSNARNMDASRIGWSRGLFRLFCKHTIIAPSDRMAVIEYRPFCKKHFIYTKDLIEYPSKWDSIFPDENHQNIIISIAAAPIKKDFSVIISDCIQDYHLMEQSNCFPMYFYDRVENKANTNQLTLFDGFEDTPTVQYKQRYAISDASLKKFRDMYGSKVTKEDIFYYIYAVLQSKAYIEAYGDNLSKEMPRIPMLDKFPEYVRIGRELADLHINYERVVNPDDLGLDIQIEQEDYTVTKMAFKKTGKEVHKDTIIYNNYITISNIPERAYDYVVNGKSAIKWLLERYAVTIDKASGIKDDPNDYAGSKYIFDLLISVISVSLKTLDLIDSMPEYKEI